MSEKFYDKFAPRKPKSETKKEKKYPVEKKYETQKNPKKNEPLNKNSKGTEKKHSENHSEKKQDFELLNSQFSTKGLSKDSVSILNNFDEIIQDVRPLNSRQMQQLPDNIKALSHQLTDQRSERRLGYMNESVQLSSYVRYYTWWNLVRLTRLFVNLPSTLFPKNGQVCLDLGSGPLTLVTALWLARPELRNLDLTWYCLDVSANSMALGEDVYISVVARTGGTPWKIIRVKGPFGTSIKQKADFVSCANMFNELDQASDMPPEYQTKKYFDQLQTYSAANGNFLLIEPGVPKASRTLSLLRGRFIDSGKVITGPCPHAGECPMNGFKAYTGSQNKWCNFAFNTEEAPAKLLKLSEKAKLPKERATLCFIAVTGLNSEKLNNQQEGQNNQNEDFVLCRVASDEFSLPGHNFGFYACSKLGLTLLKIKENGSLKSGDLISVKIKTPDSLPKDEKSGAVIISL